MDPEVPVSRPVVACVEGVDQGHEGVALRSGACIELNAVVDREIRLARREGCVEVAGFEKANVCMAGGHWSVNATVADPRRVNEHEGDSPPRRQLSVSNADCRRERLSAHLGLARAGSTWFTAFCVRAGQECCAPSHTCASGIAAPSQAPTCSDGTACARGQRDGVPATFLA